MAKKILEEKKISIPEVKDILTKVFERMERMDMQKDLFSEAAWEYVNNFSKMDLSTARRIIEMLRKEYQMDESQAIQFANIDPNYPQEARVILQRDPTLRDLSDEDLAIMIQKIRDLEA